MAVSANSIKAGEGHVILGIDMTPLEKGLKDGGKMLATFGAGVAAVGAAITAPMLYGLSVLSTMGTDIFEASRKTNMSFTEVQNAANGTKVSMDELGTATKKMDAFISAAAQGSPEAVDQLAMMGLTIRDLAGLSEYDRLLVFADGLQRIGDAAQRSHAQVAVFGRGGLSMNLTGGAAGVRDRAERRAEVGGILSDADVRTAKAFSTTTQEMAAATRGAWMQLGAAAAPIMIWYNNLLTSILITVRKWVEANRPLLTTIFAIGDKLLLVGGLIAALGGGFIAAGAAIGGISAAFTAASGAIATAMGVIMAPWFLWGVIIVGVGILIWQLAQIFPEFGKIFEGFGKSFEGIGATFSQMLQGINDAISAGNLQRAFEIASLGIEMTFARTTNALERMWGRAIDRIIAEYARLLNIRLPNLDPNAAELSGTPDQYRGLTILESRRARLAARDAAEASGTAANSPERQQAYDTALQNEINRRLAAEMGRAGLPFVPVSIRNGVIAGTNPYANLGTERESPEERARTERLEALQVQMDYLANESASEAYAASLARAEEALAGAPGGLQMQLSSLLGQQNKNMSPMQPAGTPDAMAKPRGARA